mmetsp:Transcript_60852/g.108613  ORF Transcript_60852/g.108613 Transcript_60852/m.108613 type:complete len:290 (-) Transcript_60852:88-957(-)
MEVCVVGGVPVIRLEPQVAALPVLLRRRNLGGRRRTPGPWVDWIALTELNLKIHDGPGGHAPAPPRRPERTVGAAAQDALLPHPHLRDRRLPRLERPAEPHLELQHVAALLSGAVKAGGVDALQAVDLRVPEHGVDPASVVDHHQPAWLWAQVRVAALADHLLHYSPVGAWHVLEALHLRGLHQLRLDVKGEARHPKVLVVPQALVSFLEDHPRSRSVVVVGGNELRDVQQQLITLACLPDRGFGLAGGVRGHRLQGIGTSVHRRQPLRGRQLFGDGGGGCCALCSCGL